MEIRVDTMLLREAKRVLELVSIKAYRLFFCRDQFGGRSWLVVQRPNNLFVGIILESEKPRDDRGNF